MADDAPPLRTYSQDWVTLCLDEIGNIDAWERVITEEGKRVHPDMLKRRQCYRDLLRFLDIIEMDRAAHEALVMKRMKMPKAEAAGPSDISSQKATTSS